MKKSLLVLTFIFAIVKLFGQEYYTINFAGAGADLETVLVENLTQGTSLTMEGTKSLHLVIQGTSIDEVMKTPGNQLSIYPNPFEHSCHIEFVNLHYGRVNIQLFGISGTLMHDLSSELDAGRHTFLLTGVPSGSYLISVKTSTDVLSGKFIVRGQSKAAFSLQHTNQMPLKNAFEDISELNTTTQIAAKSTGSSMEMDFSPGDELLFVGFASGFDNSGIYDSPTGNQTYTFEFTNWWPEDYEHCFIVPTAVADVMNPTTGKTWMDRNLGASRAATSSTDEASYGDLFQWGRFADGHQCRDSETTSSLSDSDQPGNGIFILTSFEPYDWRQPQNTNLWQGVNGINNPCPSGYRVPTETELNSELAIWDSNNSIGAYASPLKLPVAGSRYFSNGLLGNVGSYGYYWSSTVSGTSSRNLIFNSSNATMGYEYRALGSSVRCIKDEPEAPTVTSSTVSEITFFSATTSGVVTDDGGAPVNARGVVWSQMENPTVENHEGITIDGEGLGSFTSTLTELEPETTYYVRAYATNSIGTAYGDELSFETEEDPYPPGTVHCGDPTLVVEVLNPATGKTWMDRNLGASRVAQSSNDGASYGDLYQWGRFADGHQCRDSETTSTLATSDTPGHGNFITVNSSNDDWRNPQNDNLWQGVNSINNPCPTGYRLPTEAELFAERQSWSNSNSDGAFASQLKLPLPGRRDNRTGAIGTVGTNGFYWSSTVSGVDCLYLAFNSSGVAVNANARSHGFSVRCIKNEPELPIINTAIISDISATTAASGGEVTHDGGAPVTARGMVWSQTENPTVENHEGITIDGEGLGSFTSTLTELEPQTTYFARAYATNNVGTAYGDELSFETEEDPYPPGTVHCGAPTEVVDVTNPTTGKTWMDRNLGAAQAATASDDPDSYGDLYQWGRFADGHQCRNSGNTSTLSNSDTPGHGNFIMVGSSPHDWRSPQNNNLWQGVNGTNNPCPIGYRLPTEAELNEERLSWSTSNAAGAFASPLKLAMAGFRNYNNGMISDEGSYGANWSGTVSATSSRNLAFFYTNATMFTAIGRSYGLSVRCIKNDPDVPNITTTTVSEVSATTALSGGEVTHDGGAPVTARGVVWSQTENPTVESHEGITIDGEGLGSFTSTLTELEPQTTYFVRAYATNNVGTAYGDEFPFETEEDPYPPGTVHCGDPTLVVEVLNPVTGKTWMDRNLGASQVATSSSDANSYGDLYQWGRFADGHQCRDSETTTTLSDSDSPGHSDFILVLNIPNDWRNPQNVNLWQGVNGTNNPCPSGYRLPTEAELNAERQSWGSNNAAGAFASPLKLPVAGYRLYLNGSLHNVGSGGSYWSSKVSGTTSHILYFNSSNAYIGTSDRANGNSVRCIKD